MPLLEFRCDACSARVEELVLAGDAPPRPVCPACGSRQLSRLLSTFAAQTGGSTSSAAFDASTACGGGACRMPDVCGAGGREN